MTQHEVLTPKQRRERNRQEMVDNILSIAREMMRADGVAALSLNGIARRLGMTTPALYTYFDSKHAIYDALFRLGFEEFGQRMRPPVLERETPFEQLEAIFEQHMAFALDNPDLYQLMMQRPVPGFVPSEESMAVSLDNLQEASEWLQRVFERMEFTLDMPVEEARDLLFAMSQGLTDLHLANDPGAPVGQGRFGKLPPRAAQLFINAMQPGKD
ncbi:MAG: TetR/AcrR family transcriptional regulator [Chloroflexota bacterium]|nr:MAG: TetR/AcrR family transcriptional regulator [Chloroflexota bacterium]